MNGGQGVKGWPESYRPHTVPRALGALAGEAAAEVREANAREGVEKSGRVVGKAALVLPVGPDLKTAVDWYAELFGRSGAAVAGAEAAAIRLPAGGHKLVPRRTDRERPGLAMAYGGTPHPVATFNVPSVDRFHARVLAAGGESLMMPCDLFFRMAMFRDPFGNGLALLEEPFGWGKRIGRTGAAATFDWLKIPVSGSTDDLLHTAAWYAEHLGLEPGPLNEERDGLDLQPGNIHLQLVDTGFAGRFAEGSRSVPLAELAAEDAEALHRKLVEAKADVSPLVEKGAEQSFTFVDPNGVAIGVVQR